MRRLNLRIDGELAERFFKDAAENKRGPQAEFEYLVDLGLHVVYEWNRPVMLARQALGASGEEAKNEG